jgi:protein-S-isoprenylcysteine O-methyltransferase Ste14
MYHQLELARSGEALFKVRGKYLKYVGLLSVAIAFFVGASGPFNSETANLVWFWAAFGVASAGAVLRLVTSGYAALGTSGSNKIGAIAAELNTTGPYALVRNPLYTGRILNFTGIAMLSGSWVYGALTFLVSVLVYERISVYEEEFLREEFGESHSSWAEQVPFLLPRLHGWTKPKYPFWVRRCIKREEKKIIWLLSVVAFCDFAQRGFDPANLPDNLVWYYLWAAGLLAYAISRGLRYFTNTYENIS